MVRHHCHAEGCSVLVPPRMFACRLHWSMVPSWLQRALWKVYREGQEVTKQVTPAYLAVQTRCRLFIAQAEGKLDTAQGLRAELLGRLRAAIEGHPEELLSDDDLLSRFDALLCSLR